MKTIDKQGKSDKRKFCSDVDIVKASDSKRETATANEKSSENEKKVRGIYTCSLTRTFLKASSHLYMAACTPIVYLGGREEMKYQRELCKFYTVFHYRVTN